MSEKFTNKEIELIRFAMEYLDSELPECDSALMKLDDMQNAGHELSQVAHGVQTDPVEFCEDAALSVAERTFSTEVDERLAGDIIQYAQRLHSLYTAHHKGAKM